MTRQFSAGGTVYKNLSQSKRTLRSSPASLDAGLRKGLGASSEQLVKWLIIKPKSSPDFPKERFQLPKGLIDKGESSQEAALREVREETGIKAKIIEKVDDAKIFFTFQGEKIFKIISYYLMEYISGEPSADHKEVDEVLWLPFEEAKKKLTYSTDKSVLQKANELLLKKK